MPHPISSTIIASEELERREEVLFISDVILPA